MREDVVINYVLGYFDEDVNFKKLSNLVSGAQFHPRFIDYYTTQYSKQCPQFFFWNENLTDVYSSYKVMLKSFHKKRFNIFDKGVEVKVRSLKFKLGRLHVYKWLIENGIYDRMLDSYEEVVKSYCECKKRSNIKKNARCRRRRSFLHTPHIVTGLKSPTKKIAFIQNEA